MKKEIEAGSYFFPRTSNLEPLPQSGAGTAALLRH